MMIKQLSTAVLAATLLVVTLVPTVSSSYAVGSGPMGIVLWADNDTVRSDTSSVVASGEQGDFTGGSLTVGR